MKKLLFFALAIAVVFMLSGCAGYTWVKKTPEQIEDVKVAKVVEKKAKEVGKERKDKTLQMILDELLKNGEEVDRDVHARTWVVPDGKGSYKEVSYSWERLVVKSNDSDDYHAIIFEFGVLRNIEPVDDVADAKKKFKPYGGWKK